MTMKCELERATIYYETHGEGTPLLTIHGFPLDHRVMKGCLEPILTAPYLHEVEIRIQRIYFDLPGMGRTTLHSDLTSSDDIFDILLEFIDAIIPETPFLLAGESYGGYLARGIVRKRPEQVIGLMLICPLIEPVQEKRRLPPRTILHRDESLTATLTEGEKEEFDYGATIQTEEVWIRYCSEILSGMKVADLRLLERLAENAYPLGFDVDDLTVPFQGPSLFLMGRQDSVVGYEDALELRNRYPRAHMVILYGAGHSLQIEQPELFNFHVRGWLEMCKEQGPH